MIGVSLSAVLIPGRTQEKRNYVHAYSHTPFFFRDFLGFELSLTTAFFRSRRL
jgi:hypothetical protein